MTPVLVLLASLLAPPLPSVAPGGAIALKSMRDGFYVEVPIGSGPPGLFLVDSGSYRSFATNKGYDRLVAAGARAGRDHALAVPSLSLGGFPAGPASFALDGGDNPLDPKVDGLIGMDVLSRFRVGLDLSDPAKATMRLWPAGAPFEDVRREWLGSVNGSNEVPVVSETMTAVKNAYYVPLLLDGEAVSMIIDTASTFTSVSPVTAKRLGWDRIVDERGIGYPSGKVVKLTYYRIDKIALGGLTLPGKQAVATFEADGDGLLGSDIIGWFRMLLDFPGKKAYFTPAGWKP